jgi:hypothetical protein
VPLELQLAQAGLQWHLLFIKRVKELSWELLLGSLGLAERQLGPFSLRIQPDHGLEFFHVLQEGLQLQFCRIVTAGSLLHALFFQELGHYGPLLAIAVQAAPQHVLKLL